MRTVARPDADGAAQARGVAGQVRAPFTGVDSRGDQPRDQAGDAPARRERDAQIYAASADPDLESDAYALWAARNAGQVWSELD